MDEGIAALALIKLNTYLFNKYLQYLSFKLPIGEYSKKRCTRAPTSTSAPGPSIYLETIVYINRVNIPIRIASNRTVEIGRGIIEINR